MKEDFYVRLYNKLNEVNKWPSIYLYKFIVPINQVAEVKKLFKYADISVKESSKGTYSSISAKVMALNATEIIDLYKKASKIKGIISL